MTKKELKFIINAAVLLVVAITYFAMRNLPHNAPASGLSQSAKQAGQYYYVKRTVDGDTIKLLTGESVRLIGIDAPESNYNSKLERDAARSRKDVKVILAMGKEASDFAKRLVNGKRVKLEYDVVPRDKYGRLLAYVYLEDGTFVNAKIVEEGYAQTMTIPPNVKYADYFSKLQREAREKGRGLWKTNPDERLF